MRVFTYRLFQIFRFFPLMREEKGKEILSLPYPANPMIKIATTSPKITIVSGITVKIKPLPNNCSFSAIAPIAAVPIAFSAIADASAGDTVQLNTSITNSTGTCINFADADNIIFDCMNYDNFIEGDDAGSDYGIYLTANGVDGSNNLIVRNCNVSDFEYGVYIESLNNTLVNITSTSNVLSGIYLLNGADNNSLSNANSSFNGEVGILISSSSNNNFTSCNIISNQIGVRFAPSSYNNTISDSLIKFSSEQGVYRDLINSDGNSLEDVNISSNKYGIYIEGSAVLPP